MRVLLILNHPNSSLEVLAQAIISAVEIHGIEVVLLYRRMFFEALITYPYILNHIDVVHFVHGVENYPYEYVKLVSCYCPTVTSYHHSEEREIPKQLELIKHLFYVSHVLHEDVSRFALPEGINSLLRNGVNTHLFYPDSRQKKNHSVFTIGFFGTQPPQSPDRKGSVLLVRTAWKLVSSGYKPDFVIVGYGWQELVSDLRRMGLTVFYHINVPYSDLPKLYRKLDLYLITSLLEGGPLTLLEAGACGVPVISTPVGLALDVLTKPGCGRLLTGFDSDEIATAIIDDIEHRDQSKKRADAVLREIQQHWDWNSTYKDLYKTYHQLGQVNKDSKISSFSDGISILPPYLNFTQDAQLQRLIVRKYAMSDLALRLHRHGDRLSAWRLALLLIATIKPSYWWRFLRFNTNSSL